MHLKSCRYMEKPKFKARQDSFDFFCETAYEFLLKFRDECREGWSKLFSPGKTSVAVQESLFDTLKTPGITDIKKEPKPLFFNSIALPA